MAMTPEEQELLFAIRKRLQQRIDKSYINNARNPPPNKRAKHKPSCLEDLIALNNLVNLLELELSHVTQQNNSIL